MRRNGRGGSERWTRVTSRVEVEHTLGLARDQAETAIAPVAFSPWSATIARRHGIPGTPICCSTRHHAGAAHIYQGGEDLGETLLSLIEEILDFPKIEAGT
jgi:hypothetical protein